MIESYLGLGIGFLVAFFCMFFYRRGLKDGINLSQKKVEPIVKKPEFLKTPVEKAETKADLKRIEDEQKLEGELNALFSYQGEKR